ncbi:MAG TPA: ATP phosphoribosyltransferase regulatory subunit [Kofleriaceae bacterium]|nr:ATP phosphoribosyltransferase regulatory subunit [Kofleriaceae bacterium]
MSTPPSPVRLPAGVRDFLPRAAARRRAISERVLGELEAWGYTRLVTPVFECADVLERGLGADARAAALRFVEPGSGEVVALRPDFTPQVARIAATRLGDVAGPLRLCYEGAVNRLTSAQRGPLAQREILQAGIELVDAGGPEADGEALAVASATLAHLGVEAAPLDVGHVAPTRHVLEAAPEASRAALASALGKKDRAQVARAGGALAEALVGLTGPADQVLARARALPWPDVVQAALDDLAAALAAAARLLPGVQFTVDLGEVRGFDYYTGLRFAGYARGAGDAVLRGGRYDELVGRYGRDARAIGFAVDIEAIAQAQRAAGVAPPPPPRGALIVVDTGAVPGDGLRAATIAATLRASGLRAAVDLGDAVASPGSRVRYAVETGWTHLIDLAGATLHDTHTGATAAIPSQAITAALDGDGAPLSSILAGRRP